MSEDRPADDAGAPTVYRVVLRVERNGEVVGETEWHPEVRAHVGQRWEWSQYDADEGEPDEMLVECEMCNQNYAEADIVRHWLLECGT